MADTATNVIELSDEVREAFARIRERYTGDQLGPIKARVASAVEAKLEFLADRNAQLEETVRRLRADYAQLFDCVASCTCGSHPTYDLVAHEQLPSRKNPFAAAFAVNARAEKAGLQETLVDILRPSLGEV